MDKRLEANRLVREKICNATFRLMKSRPLSEISVTEIIREAGVARVSFYRNFTSKEEVVGMGLAELTNGIVAFFQKNLHNLGETARPLWDFFAQQKNLLLNLCAGGEPGAVLGDLLAKAVSSLSTGMSSERERYRFSAYIGALSSVLLQWLRGGCKETPERMAEIFGGMWSNGAAPAGA